MPKKIFFVRHAKALDREDWNAKGRPDFDRPLKKKGSFEFEHFCLKFPVLRKVEKVYSSELKRAVQTAEIIQRVYQTPFVTDPLINHGVEPRLILQFLESRKEDVIAYTGHEPEISIMMKLLIRTDFNLVVKKGSILVVNYENEGPQLESFTHPKLLSAS